MPNPVVTIADGQIKGKIDKDYLGNPYYCFLGVPYGKAPIGELRFKAPVPVEPWDGVKDATREGPECPSRHLMFKHYIGAEDNCLHVNIYTPQLPSDNVSTVKPVMVWIHGGGFLYDSNKREMYGPDYLISQDIVLVSVNYRLGVFGFLSLEDPSLGVPGNAGMKDMILALQWVQKNIKNFCGDPNNVTIFGESAGSAAVHYLYLSPKSKGLFHKAIAMSGCVLNSWAPGCTNGSEIAKNLDFKETDEAKILEYLKGLSSQKIIQAQHRYEDTFIASTVRPFGPVVEKYSTDSAFLTEEPLDIIKNGTFNQVPLMIGNTSREGILSEAARKLLGESTVGSNMEDEIYYYLKLKKGSEESKKIADSIKKFYFGEEEPSQNNVEQYYLLKTDNMFVHGTYKTVNYQKQKSEAPIYFYEMSLETPISLFKNICLAKYFMPTMFFYFLAYKAGDGAMNKVFLKMAKRFPRNQLTGACHGDDLSYLFKSILSERVLPGSDEEIHVKRFLKLWTNFARTGNPTPDEQDELLENVVWKPVTKEENRLLDIGTKLEMKGYPNTERMQFWDSIFSF